MCAWVCHFSDRLSRIADRTVGDFSHGALSRARLARALVCVRSAAGAKLGAGPPSILAEAPDTSAMGVVLDFLAPWKRSRERFFPSFARVSVRNRPCAPHAPFPPRVPRIYSPLRRYRSCGCSHYHTHGTRKNRRSKLEQKSLSFSNVALSGRLRRLHVVPPTLASCRSCARVRLPWGASRQAARVLAAREK